MSIAEIITGLGGLLSGVVALTMVVADRRKRQAESKKLESEAHDTDCDAAQKITMAAGNLSELYDKRLCRLERVVEEQETEIVGLKALTKKQEHLLKRFTIRIDYLMSGIEQLTDQFGELHIAPSWRPDKWDPDDE